MELKGIQYLDILKLLIKSGYPNKMITDNPIEKSWIIRHDVDNLINRSVQMAQLEHKYKVRTTYYMLNYDTNIPRDRNYFYQSIDEYRLINSLGHHIGWHNNALSEFLMTNQTLKECIELPLMFLRELGIPILSTASHGDQLCRKMNYVNYQIWNEFDKGNDLQHDRFDLKQFGFTHEAYLTNRTHYLSESGGNWQVNPLEYIQEWIDNGTGNLQILIHPQWWS